MSSQSAGIVMAYDGDDVIVLLRVWRAHAEVWVSAADAADASRVADEVKARVPPVAEDGRVTVNFSDSETGTRSLQLAVRPWTDVRGLFPAQ